MTTLLTAMSAVFAKIIGLPWWQIPLAFLAILLSVSTPSMVIAALKLRLRNLGPILDANGWAVNARARINIPFGRSLTKTAVLPANSSRSLIDPYADKHGIRNTIVACAIVGAAIWSLWY